ncbi:response regulator transcription factor [Pseudorhodoferax sp. Leaf274]|uniref:response regulator transcription factor n=1 Tax=Pseudorhodoferax sp. Leaf274 TaxID=1736318 RepID=UPI00070333AA|nr:response regulator transcription factor [Pseudorhodoferax sp. Leaf274]KQP38798.1 two-component system response regulator [Pseudorhodoferax sp. Leaf274]
MSAETPYRAGNDASAPPALVYVIEDDADVARLVLAALRDFGFACEVFATGGAVLRRLQFEKPDLCIVDLGLPDMDGLDLMRRIAAASSAGMLILTGRGHTADRVMGLELGGDDYVTKPFESRELVARVRSILRRRGAAAGTAPGQRRYANFLGWRIDCAANVLRAPDGTEHLLGTAETQVLRCFVERPHQILTREQLMGERDLSPTDRTIDVRISRLRKKIEPDSHEPAIIKTVYGAGYLFAADVSWE